jgi:hypothetical protein
VEFVEGWVVSLHKNTQELDIYLMTAQIALKGGSGLSRNECRVSCCFIDSHHVLDLKGSVKRGYRSQMTVNIMFKFVVLRASACVYSSTV